MTQVSALGRREGFGTTARRDAWWFGPAMTVAGISAFLIYGTWAALQGNNFEIRYDTKNFHKKNNPAIAPYLSPFYAPLIYDPQSEHAWISSTKPSWWPDF